MAAGSKGIGRTSSLPAQQAGADTLQAYCPDLDQWPRSWSYEAGDIPAGQQMVQCFRPFLHHLLSLHLSRKTLRQHRDNVWVLGGEIISRLQLDRGLRRRPIDQVASTSSVTTVGRCSPMASRKPSNAPSMQPAASSFAS